jgi:putative alpha-1,2-mannosidase
MYRNEPDGLCGNDDCGQMSAWYVFSVLGFYPVCPGVPQYAIGAPGVDKAVIALPNDKTLTITTRNLSDKNLYIQSVYLNGIKSEKLSLDHSAIMEGGTLTFVMGPKPSLKWSTLK